MNQVAVSYKLNDETTNQNIYGGKFKMKRLQAFWQTSRDARDWKEEYKEV